MKNDFRIESFQFDKYRSFKPQPVERKKIKILSKQCSRQRGQTGMKIDDLLTSKN